MSGFTDPADDSALTSSVVRAALNKAMPVGAMLDYLGTTAPTGWVLASAGTIGSVASSASQRANADTEDLFTLLWTNFTNTELVIEDSAGTPTTRGLSASADFAANKRMPTPDLRGRIAAGLDNLGGSSANRIVDVAADTIGKSMGEETHTLIASEIPTHSHNENMGISSGVQSNFYKATGGNAGRAIAPPGVSTADSGSELVTTDSYGSGSSHNNTQPTYFVGKIIKL